MTLPKKQQRLLQLIECPVCLNELQDPRMLSCRHALCYTCVNDYTKKNKYEKELPCPVCREVTSLYEGGVDNLPKFFFMNELKEVVLEKDGVKEDKPQKPRGVVCSTVDCEEVAVSFCTKGCEFLCQLCDDEHRTSRRTKSHKVVTVSEGEEFIKSSVPPYPPCHRHNHQVLDLYCRTCNIPICTTCCQVNHRDHDCIEIDKQAEVCKIKLEQICTDTDGLISQVKHAMDKTECQSQQAETDIDNVCDNVKTTFKKMHEELDAEEEKLLTELQEARRRMKKTVDVIADCQMLSLSCLQSLKSCQIKLGAKDSPYDYVTVTESIQKDVINHSQELPGFLWSSDIIRKAITGELVQPRVEIKESELVNKKQEQEEVGRIRLHNQDDGVIGMVVYNECVYVVHNPGLVVYCYKPDGSLGEKYEHEGEAETCIQGMCLMMHDDLAMLVVSDWSNKALVWIRIKDDFTMDHHHTQQVGYLPRGSYNDRGHLMVSDDHKIHRYTGDGQPLDVITLPDDVDPRWVTRHGDSDQFVVTDWKNHQVAVIDGEGRVKTIYENDIHGVELDEPYDITTDKQGRILIVDVTQEHVLLMSRKREEVKQLLQGQVEGLTCVCLDKESHKMYVPGCDMDDEDFVFIYDYILLTGGKTFTHKITKLEMVAVM